MLHVIESENPGNENKQKRALFKWWLEHDARASWRTLLAALARVDPSLSATVRDMYVTSTPSSTLHESAVRID